MPCHDDCGEGGARLDSDSQLPSRPRRREEEELYVYIPCLRCDVFGVRLSVRQSNGLLFT
jgi:hypothetical protein